jgi:glycosyltransferase involved in cell wall biosynthesis
MEDERESLKSTKVFVIHYGLKNAIINNRGGSQVLAKEIYNIGSVARLVPQKNIPLLLGAIQLLNTEYPAEFNLIIAGTGPLREQLNSLSIELGIETRVSWKGKILDVDAFYKGIDLFALTSNYEGFGLVLLEAMSYGIPVVARRVSAIPEVLGMRHPGLVETSSPEELAKKIIELLTNPEARRKSLMYQSKQLSRFSIEKSQYAHNQIYKNCLVEKV